jgi:hypothetical protein
VITKAQAGYVCTQDTDYLCGDCQFRKNKARCAYFGPSVPISFENGSCNRWKAGEPEGIPWLEPYFTKIQLGYVEAIHGFGCKRCAEFKVGRNACELVDRSSPGFTPGIISPQACCDFQKPDRIRGQMSNAELVQILKPQARLVLHVNR